MSERFKVVLDHARHYTSAQLYLLIPAFPSPTENIRSEQCHHHHHHNYLFQTTVHRVKAEEHAKTY